MEGIANNIQARENKPGLELPPGWDLFKAEGWIKVDDQTITRNFELQAANVFEASKYTIAIGEYEAGTNHKFKITRIDAERTN